MIPIIAAGAAPPFFAEVAALVVAGAAIAYLCNRLGVMPIVGFLVAGAVIGPNAIGLVHDQELVDAAAEVGVILLLFTIGIEFSLEKLAKIQRLIFGGGGLQVGITTAVVVAILVPLGVAWQAALFTGFLLALSSTAIVLKMLSDRREMREDYAQVGLGLLIFQDLAIIVMVLLVPLLAPGDGGEGGGSMLGLLWALTKAGLLIAAVLILARRVMPRVLEAVARTCSPELFLLTVIGICFGTAFLTSLAGVSLSLGAFLAGLIVSESRFSEHAMSEILPLQILFSATFFISVGMLLDVGFLIQNLPLVFGILVAAVVIKVVITGISVKMLGYAMPVAITSAFVLAQVGEFSFVLERAGRDVGLFPGGIEGAGSQAFIAATVLGMLLTPVLASVGRALGGRMANRMEHEASEQMVAAASDLDDTEQVAGHGGLPALADHVVVAGYGDAARRLVRALRSADVPFVITTLNPEGANEAESDGMPVLRGDARKERTLRLAGLSEARLMVIPDDDPATAGHIAMVARTISESVPIIVRTRLMADVAALHHEGVSSVIAEEMEGTVQLFAEALQHLRVPAVNIEALVNDIRSSDYAALLHEQDGIEIVHDAEPLVLETRATAEDCTHLDKIRPVRPKSDGCQECLAIGDEWVHLRVCMICGHVGCCDSSKNKHATAHFHATGHEIMRSLEPGEEWGWCFVDRVEL